MACEGDPCTCQGMEIWDECLDESGGAPNELHSWGEQFE